MVEEPSNELHQLRIIYQTAPMGIALLNEELIFLTCNPMFVSKLGFTLEDLWKKTFFELCHPWDREKARYIITSAKNEDFHYLRDEIRLNQKLGSYLWVEISVQYISRDIEGSGRYVIMIQNIQKRKEIQQEVIELKRRLFQSNENERKNLAHELHDGPMQELHSILFQIAEIIDDVPAEAKHQLELIEKTIKGLNIDLRAIAYNLRPPALSKFGLARSIKSHADEIKLKHPELTIKLDLVSDRNIIAEEVSLALFRIYQQSIMNVIRHANASEVIVRLNMDGGAVNLEISDDGEGFEVPKKWVSLVRLGHYGLAGTSERVSALGGDFKINSAPGKGTKIVVKIPDYMEK